MLFHEFGGKLLLLVGTAVPDLPVKLGEFHASLVPVARPLLLSAYSPLHRFQFILVLAVEPRVDEAVIARADHECLAAYIERAILDSWMVIFPGR
ncbi:hypothetical protein GF325_17880 [Candidatus Bathyarchaeota archaeon]|nr:hypothetical protein [Candidatus Bathyarchaeota archaeon]